jgi:phospholipid transport system transporter-binding protein
MTAEVRVQNTNQLILEGDVTAENSVALRNTGEEIIRRMTSRGSIDLAALSSANTITLSLLLSWLRSAKHNNVSLTITRPPGKLFDMARVSGLESILPFDAIDC